MNELADLGILNGYPDQSFRGHQPMTRYEAIVATERVRQDVLRWWRTIHPSLTFPTKPAQSPPLKDIPPAHWAVPEVRTLHEEIGVDQGILTGYPDGTLHGQQPITRAEFAVLFQRLVAWFGRLAELQPKPAPKEKSLVSFPTPSPYPPCYTVGPPRHISRQTMLSKRAPAASNQEKTGSSEERRGWESS